MRGSPSCSATGTSTTSPATRPSATARSSRPPAPPSCSANRAAIEAGTLEGPPAIDPLVLPTRDVLRAPGASTSGHRLELIQINIHSDDAAVIWLAEQRLLLCGDTMEDTITYVAEPERFDAHIADLELLSELEPGADPPQPRRPRGDRRRRLQPRPDRRHAAIHPGAQRAARTRSSATAAARADRRPARGRRVDYFEPYEAVHRENLETVLALSG